MRKLAFAVALSPCVADADVVAGGGEVGEEALLVGEVAADLELAAAGGGGEVFDVEAVFVEGERAVEVAEAIGNAFDGEVDVLEEDVAGERRLLDEAFGGDLEGDLAGGDEVGVEGVGERHADAAVGGEIELAALRVGVCRRPATVPLARRSVSSPVMCTWSSVTVPLERLARNGSEVLSSMPCSLRSKLLNSAVPESFCGVAAGPETVMVPAMSELPLKLSGAKSLIPLADVEAAESEFGLSLVASRAGRSGRWR